ncbi:MAG: hypothetical protein JNM60_11295 [Candidatus Competibacteraceae bacterium]|nr:hypothetical protein [Candidatus Competibacteraceae bacterium]
MTDQRLDRHAFRITSGWSNRCYWFQRLDQAIAEAIRLLPSGLLIFDECWREEPDEDWEYLQVATSTLILYAFAAGWAGEGLDRMLEVWADGEDAVTAIAVICRHSSQLAGGGLTEGQAQLLLRRLERLSSPEFLARALAKASFHPALASETAEQIRGAAKAFG